MSELQSLTSLLRKDKGITDQGLSSGLSDGRDSDRICTKQILDDEPKGYLLGMSHCSELNGPWRDRVSAVCKDKGLF